MNRVGPSHSKWLCFSEWMTDPPSSLSSQFFKANLSSYSERLLAGSFHSVLKRYVSQFCGRKIRIVRLFLYFQHCVPFARCKLHVSRVVFGDDASAEDIYSLNPHPSLWEEEEEEEEDDDEDDESRDYQFRVITREARHESRSEVRAVK